MTHAPPPDLDGLPDIDHRLIDQLTMAIGGFALVGGAIVVLHALLAPVLAAITPAAITVGCLLATLLWLATVGPSPGDLFPDLRPQ